MMIATHAISAGNTAAASARSTMCAIALSVGRADSLNPSTVGPALYLATTPRRVRRILAFTLGVFGVNLLAGTLLAVGPGRLVPALFPHPRKTVVHALELAAGVVLL